MEKVIDIGKVLKDTFRENYTKEGKRYESDNVDCISLTSELSSSTAPTYQNIPVPPFMTQSKESNLVFSSFNTQNLQSKSMLNMFSGRPSIHQILMNYKYSTGAIDSLEDEKEDNFKKQKQSLNNETSQKYNNVMLSNDYYN